MNIEILIAHLREHCPLFERRVGGGLDIEAVNEGTRLDVPSAHVLFAGDDPERPAGETYLTQAIVDEFHLLVIVANPDERGQASAGSILAARRQLLRALVGWPPSDEHDGAEYQGCKLVKIDRAHAFYLFSFAAEWQLGSVEFDPAEREPETWPEVEVVGLPDLTGVGIDVDLIDPGAGPVGRIEHRLDINLE